MLCETNLDDSIHSSEVFPQNFVVYRCDRSDDTEKFQLTKKKRGGGVMIAIEKSMKSQLIGTGAIFGAEQIWVKISSKFRDIILIEIYIRPDSPLEVYEANMRALREAVAMMNQTDVLILSGDFNLPKLSWFTDDIDDPEIAIPINAAGKKEINVLDTCHELGLLQINKYSNMNNRMLDLVWTNYLDMVSCCVSKNHLLKHESHHPAFEIEIHDLVCNQINTDSKLKYRDFVNADYDIINEKLQNVNWDDILSGNNLDREICDFYDIVNSVISENVELKNKKTSNHPKWFNGEIINMKNRVSKLQKLKKLRCTTELIKKHAELRTKYKNCARSAFKNYKLEMEQLINEDPRKFFQYVNSCRKVNDDLPCEMVYNGVKFNSQQEIAESFAEHFATAYTQPNDISADHFECDERFLKEICSHIPTIEINEDIILEKVKHLPNNTVSGPDDIPNIFVKRCIHSLITPITRILSESLITGFVPNIWKSSFVRPVHKSGVRTNIENYRGVAIQCVIPKLLDSVISSHINEHILQIIDDSQHGFVKGKSTLTNLAEFSSRVLTNMEKHNQTDAIYLDIAKAFDSVNVKLLIQKLKIMGLNEQILSWIRHYLAERQQIVNLNEVKSNPIVVTSGTGQGYPIGSTLFVLFIVDLPHHVKNSGLQSFADDTRIWKHIVSSDDCYALQYDLDSIVKFFRHNQLILNVNKSMFISFHRRQLKFDFKYSIDNEPIKRVEVIKDLGILLDSNMNFNAHIEFMTAKAKSRLAWIKHFGKEFDDPWTIKRLFFTFVLPIIEYGSLIWNPYTADKNTKIESIQKQFLLYALRKLKWPHRFKLPSYTHRLLLLQMITLEERRKIAQIVFVQNIIHGDISSMYISDNIRLQGRHHRTRNSNFLALPVRKCDYSKYEPINYMLTTYNDFYNLKVTNSDNYLIDHNVNIETIKLRLNNYFKSIRSR